MWISAQNLFLQDSNSHRHSSAWAWGRGCVLPSLSKAVWVRLAGVTASITWVAAWSPWRFSVFAGQACYLRVARRLCWWDTAPGITVCWALQSRRRAAHCLKQQVTWAGSSTELQPLFFLLRSLWAAHIWFKRENRLRQPRSFQVLCGSTQWTRSGFWDHLSPH